MTLTDPTTRAAEPGRADATIACVHCGQPIGEAPAAAGDKFFCCHGCRAAHQTITQCGLDAYYKLRDGLAGPPAPPDEDFAALDTAAFERSRVEQLGNGLRSADFVLEGVTCGACVWLVEQLPRVVDGVMEARLSLRDSTVRVVWKAEQVKLSAVAQGLQRLGYQPHPARSNEARRVHREEARKHMASIGAAFALAGNVMLLAIALYAGGLHGMGYAYEQLFRWMSMLLGVIALAWPGRVFLVGAWRALRAGGVNLDVPIALALVGGGIAGTINTIQGRGEIYYDSLTILVLLLLVGRYLKFRQQRHAEDSLDLLLSLAPATCRLVRDNETATVPIEAVKPGDLVEVRSGETLAVDGVVESGSSSINPMLLTGESVPQDIGVGDEVFASSLNSGSMIRVRVTGIGDDARVAKLMKLVERGVASKPQIVQFTDRAAPWFVAGVVSAAIAVVTAWAPFGWVGAIDHAVALLIVACPCVLSFAVPLTLALAMGGLARRNILVKSGVAIERLAGRGVILLDKTGTLTRGELALTDYTGPDWLRPFIAAAEQSSAHPAGRAIHQALHDSSTTRAEVYASERTPGGVVATVDGRELVIGSEAFLAVHGITPPPELTDADSTSAVVYAAVDAQTLARMTLRDTLRPDAVEAVQRLHGLGWQVRILSGDRQAVVDDIARQVGVAPEHATGGVTPEGKLDVVNDLNGTGDAVVMVGDGVNDAAALAAADVGIAVHGSAEASLAAADLYIARDGVGAVVEAVEASRRAIRNAYGCLTISLTYNVIALSLAAAGIMTPLLAAIIMPLSSGSVVLFAASRIRRPSANPASQAHTASHANTNEGD